MGLNEWLLLEERRRTVYKTISNLKRYSSLPFSSFIFKLEDEETVDDNHKLIPN